MLYRFQWRQELFWAVLTACAVVLLTNLLTFDPDQIDNWQKWAIALGSALVRTAAGAALDVVRRLMTQRQTDESMRGKLPVIHSECGHPAFLTNAPANADELIDAGEAFTLDGQQLNLSAGVACNHCGQSIKGARVMSGVWIAHTEAGVA